MRDRKSIQGVRDSYRRRQQMGPFIVGGIAVVFLVVGGLFLALTVADGGIGFNPFATKTPTPTATLTPSLTPTITETPTITLTPEPSETWTPSPTATISGPFTYRVEEGDTLYGIAEKFGVELLYLMSYNNLRDGNIFIGEEIIIPPKDSEPPTTTPLPTYLPKGRVIEVVVVPNDSLNGLASKYNSTVEAILEENKDILDPKNPIVYVGQVLKIPVNLVTPTMTATPQLPVRQTMTQAALQGTPTP